jgi:hypothetical protein
MNHERRDTRLGYPVFIAQGKLSERIHYMCDIDPVGASCVLVSQEAQTPIVTLLRTSFSDRDALTDNSVRSDVHSEGNRTTVRAFFTLVTAETVSQLFFSTSFRKEETGTIFGGN